jgi:hypothetical protein
MLADLRKVGRTITGGATVDEVNKKGAEVYGEAQVKMEEEWQRTQRTVASPEYRKELRLQIARSIRGPDQQLVEGAKVDKLEQGFVQNIASAATSGKDVLTPAIKTPPAAKASVFAPLAAIGGVAAVVLFNR